MCSHSSWNVKDCNTHTPTCLLVNCNSFAMQVKTRLQRLFVSWLFLEKPVTFGNMIVNNASIPNPSTNGATVDEFIMYVMQYLPTVIAAQLTMEPTAEYVSAT